MSDTPRMIFVNLPVADLERSKAFYEALGFTNEPRFSDDTAAAIAEISQTDKGGLKVKLHDKNGALDKLAVGDLAYRMNQPLTPEYEALRAKYNQTIDGLSDTIAQVASSANSVHTGASEIRAASDDLSALERSRTLRRATTTAQRWWRIRARLGRLLR